VNPELWLPLAVAANVFVALGVAFYAGVVRRESWLSPLIQFLIFLELFTLPLPVRAMQTLEIEGDVTEHLPRIYPFLAPSVALVTLGILVFVTAYYLPICERIAGAVPCLAWRRDKPLYPAVAAICGGSLALIALLARDVGGILPFVLLGYGAAAQMYGKGYLAAGFPWFFVGAMLLLVRFAVYRRRADLLMFGLCWGLIAAINAVMGNRNAILYQGITFVVFWHLSISKVTFRRAAPLIAVAFLLLNLLGFLRSARYESLGDVVTRGVSSLGRFEDTGELHHGLFYTLTTGEFVVPFETLPTLMAASQDEVRPRWGATLGTALSLLVPSALWPDRPLPLGNWYMATFYGSGFGLNEGRAFFFAAEGWLNFGPAGVLLVMGIWGVFWGVLGAYVKKPGLQPLAALVAALCIAYMQRLVAGDSATFLVALPEQSLLPLLLAFPFIARASAARRTAEDDPHRVSTRRPLSGRQTGLAPRG
jgi:hypothetical protein